ncbi:MAG TPA: hypothetical protein VFT95_07575 [Micromonosporaceae bacterium]|nr:hypothetical protein [Micromonosporaceae bacterium]
MFWPTTHSRRLRTVAGLAAGAVVIATLTTASAPAGADVRRYVSTVIGSDGSSYSITNHLESDLSGERGQHRQRRQWLLAWAGDAAAGADGQAEPDFLAVIDATRGSRDYGRVVNTVTIDSVFGNEPHHMQYVWHKGDRIFAGGLLSDTTYVFDATHLPRLRLSGVVRPGDTPCGSAPDAFHVLSDGTAYASYVGGPDAAGACRYTNGEVRVGNGYLGSPGEVVRIGRDGRVLAEAPVAGKTGEDRVLCPNVPELPAPTCANPHGLAVREDLDRMLTSDFAELHNLIPARPLNPYLARDTIRVFDISNRNNPRLLSTTRLPDGPRTEIDPTWEEPRAAMEVTPTHQRRHRGAFVTTMAGGAVFYAPDITAPTPQWREIFDDSAAFGALFPTDTPTPDSDGGSWVYVSPDDKFLFHVVLQGGFRSPGERETGMLYVLDIRPTLAAGNRVRCSIDTVEEITAGGAEADCPRLVDVQPIRDTTTGGPHWAAMDNFDLDRSGFYRETTGIDRIATSNYFVSGVGSDGDHRVCITRVSPHGRLSLDGAFRDELTGEPCVDFDRDRWPHGATGWARPHGLLFAVAAADVR